MEPVANNESSRGLDVALGLLAGLSLLALCIGTLASIRSSAREVASLRDVLRVRDEWRAFVRECPTRKAWRMVDGTFAAGPLKAEVGPGRITFHLDVGEKVLILPPGMRAELGVDLTKGIAPAAVLTLTWTSSRAGLKRQHVVPVVGCAEMPAQPKSVSGIGQ